MAGLVGAIKVGSQDFNVSLQIPAEPGFADSGNLDADLTTLFESVGEAAREQDTALALFVDELQYVNEPELGALIMALHRSAQRQLPVTLLGAGLPQLVARTATAKSYAERLFDFPEIGPLSAEAARLAVEAPANRLGVDFAAEALTRVLKETACYPYFLQEWGKHCWDCAEPFTVTLADAETATATATAELDAGFFRARFDRLAPSEKRYLRAMAARRRRPAPIRRGGRDAWAQRPGRCADTRQTHRQRDDLQPGARRHGIHGAAVRCVSAPRPAFRTRLRTSATSAAAD